MNRLWNTRPEFGHARQLDSGRWQASYTRAGQTFTGPHTFDTEADARAWLSAERARLYTDAHRWEAAIADCTDILRRSRLAASTCDRVAKHLRMFAAEVETAPYAVTAEQLHGWLDGRDCTDGARRAYRTSLRTFYRWAYRAGRVVADPSERPGPHPLARPIADSWHTITAAYRTWLRAASLTAATCDLYVSILHRLGRETGAPTPWDLTADDLADWLAGHRWSRNTAHKARSVLTGFYRWAYELGHTEDNPAEALPRVRLLPPTPHPASEDAYRAALTDAGPDDALMLRLAAEAGLRRAEVAAVHSRDLRPDTAGRWWLTVRGKGERTRRLPLGRDLATLLRDRPDGYAFPGKADGHLSPAYVGLRISALLPDGVTMHALRHRFATRTYAATRDLFAVQRLLGHASPTTTQIYVQTTDDTLVAIMDAAGLA